LNTLGDVARCQGDDPRAMARYDESLRIFEELGDMAGVGGVLHNLAYLALREGDAARAATRLAESLRLFQELGNQWSVADCLVGLAEVSIALADQGNRRSDHARRAARLLGAAAALHEAVDAHDAMGEPANRVERNRIVATVRAELAPSVYDAAWAEGRAMSREQAIACAQEVCGSL
jgi:tetratricopeptide (TPR) repeat protein